MTPGGTGSRKLSGPTACASHEEDSGALLMASAIRARERPSLGTDPKIRGSEMDPLGRLSHQKLQSFMPQRCEGRAGVRE